MKIKRVIAGFIVASSLLLVGLNAAQAYNPRSSPGAFIH